MHHSSKLNIFLLGSVVGHTSGKTKIGHALKSICCSCFNYLSVNLVRRCKRTNEGIINLSQKMQLFSAINTKDLSKMLDQHDILLCDPLEIPITFK